MLYLSDQALQDLEISTPEIVERMEKLIRGQVAAQVWAAPKAALTPPGGRYLMATLSASDEPALMAVKALVVNPENPQQGLASINSSIILLNSVTGVPVATMDGNWITGVRTAAATAVAAKRMANADSSVIAFIGCGVQAHSHLEVLNALFPLAEVHAFGRGERNRDALCATARELKLNAVASATAKDAVSTADIIVTSIPITAKVDPFVDARWLKPGAFLSSTDIALPLVSESMSAFDRIIVDDLAQEASMPTPMVDPELVQGDIAGLVTDSVSGRERDTDRTAFIFRAVALGDLAVASLAYEKATATGVGARMD